MKERIHPLRSIRRAGVPLCCFETADPAQTIRGCIGALNGKSESIALMQWTLMTGLEGLNDTGRRLAGEISPDGPISTGNPSECLAVLLSKTPEDSIVFMHMANRILPNDTVCQAIWLLRDAYKAIHATLVLLAPSITLPEELKNDVVIITEPAPTEAEIKEVVKSICEDAGLPIERVDLPKVTDMALGHLSLFGVEQAVAMSITKDGVDINRMWELKVQTMKSTAGLEIMLPQENFSDLVGCKGVKSLMSAYLNGREKPRCCLWWEELEKMVAGSGDTSGTSQAMMEQFLYWTEARKVKGVLLIGVPGAGKSRTALCTAGHAKIPLMRASMSTVKGSLVGQSEAQMSRLLSSVDAVGQGRILMMATCNSVDALSPELMARFKLASFFYDYPTDEEAAAVWAYYIEKYDLTGPPPKVSNWVGREIESCCERAWLFNVSLDEASKTVVPISVANSEKMDALRKAVSGRFLSAAKPGIYVSTPRVNINAARKLESFSA